MSIGELVSSDSLYDELEVPEADRAQLEHFAKVIQRYEQRTVEGLLLIGESLWHAKERLPHGKFGRWMAAKFPQSSDDALRRCLRLFENKDQIPQRCGFSASVLDVLFAPSAGPAAIAEAVALHDEGQVITVTAAREIAAKHKAAKSVCAEPVEQIEADAGDEEPDEPESVEVVREESPSVFGELKRAFDRIPDDLLDMAVSLVTGWRQSRKESGT